MFPEAACAATRRFGIEDEHNFFGHENLMAKLL
jgi:hypothetical protein